MSINTATNFKFAQKRAVGAGLGIGIFLVPLVFVWVLLRPGYSARARTVSFGWLGLLILLGALSGGPQPASTPAPSAVAARATAEAETLRIETQEQASKERDAARDAANRAAFERYAECQARNRTPGYCAEDWQPTPDIKAAIEMVR